MCGNNRQHPECASRYFFILHKCHLYIYTRNTVLGLVFRRVCNRKLLMSILVRLRPQLSRSTRNTFTEMLRLFLYEYKRLLRAVMDKNAVVSAKFCAAWCLNPFKEHVHIGRAASHTPHGIQWSRNPFLGLNGLSAMHMCVYIYVYINIYVTPMCMLEMTLGIWV